MQTKSGFVAIIGKPNVGKSTLMNALLGERLSIITNKPQTTRKRVLGILTDEIHQIIFLDTPGILEPTYLLQKKFMEFVDHSVKDADVIVFIIDITSDPIGEVALGDERVQKILKNQNPKILLINKIDQSKEETLGNLVEKMESQKIFEEIIPISALEKFNTDLVLRSIKDKLPFGPKYYPDDQLTDEHERFFVSEIIREKIFEAYKEEVPFSTEVLIDEFVEREKSKDFISASIIVERETQKPIIIGKNGAAIKRLGRVAREAVEVFLQREVFLELRVKVRPKWRNDKRMLKTFGYETGSE